MEIKPPKKLEVAWKKNRAAWDWLIGHLKHTRPIEGGPLEFTGNGFR